MITLDTCYAAMETYGFTPSEIRSCCVSTIRAGRDSPALVPWVNKMINEANAAYGRGDSEAWTEHWKLPDWETYFAVKAQAALRAHATYIDQDEQFTNPKKSESRPNSLNGQMRGAKHGAMSALNGKSLSMACYVRWSVRDHLPRRGDPPVSAAVHPGVHRLADQVAGESAHARQ